MGGGPSREGATQKRPLHCSRWLATRHRPPAPRPAHAQEARHPPSRTPHWPAAQPMGNRLQGLLPPTPTPTPPRDKATKQQLADFALSLLGPRLRFFPLKVSSLGIGQKGRAPARRLADRRRAPTALVAVLGRLGKLHSNWLVTLKPSAPHPRPTSSFCVLFSAPSSQNSTEPPAQ